MSLWTDRELKKLIGRVNELEERIKKLEEWPGDPKEIKEALLTKLGHKPEPPDKRTKAYRDSIGK